MAGVFLSGAGKGEGDEQLFADCFWCSRGTASGKTTVARTILESVGAEQVAYFPHDAYYRDSPHLSFEERAQQNYDHPNSLENKLLVQHVQQLLAGQPVEVPVYDFTLHRRKKRQFWSSQHPLY